MDAVLEDAMLVQRHCGVRPRLGDAGGDELDREVVGDQARRAAVAHPLQHALVAAFEAAARAVQQLRIRILAQLQDHVGEAGVEAQHVAALDLDLVGLEDAHQLVVGHGMSLASEMVMQIDQHATPLRAVLREQMHAERFRLRPLVARPRLGVLVLRRWHDVFPGAKAVVEDDLRLAVAVGIEAAADVRKGVPLRRVLQRHQHDVVADDVGQVRAVLGERVAEVLPALVLAGVAYGRRDARRVTPRVECRAAGIVERQRKAEGKALLHLGDALQHLLTRHPVHAAALVVGAELVHERADFLERQDVFAWLSAAPILDRGHWVPVTAWERLSRDAAVVTGRADWHGRGEANAIQAVVDAHAPVAEGEGRLRQMREQRERQEAVRDGAAERRIPGALAIDVDPLEVVDRFGEGVDALLRDLEPGRNADFLAGALLEAANGDGGRHCYFGAAPSPWRTRSASASDAAARRDAPPGSSSSSCERKPS